MRGVRVAAALVLASAALFCVEVARAVPKDACGSGELLSNGTGAFRFAADSDGREYIVTLRGYYARDAGARIVHRALRSIAPDGRGLCEVVERDNALRRLPSDFVLLRFYNTSSDGALTEALAALRRYPLVRRVSPNMRLTRSPLALADGGDDGAAFEPPRLARRLAFDPTEDEMEDSGGAQWPGQWDGWDGAGVGGRRLLGKGVQRPVSALLQADLLWTRGFTGKGIRVAIFDTGLREDHPHFRNVVDRTDWTDEETLDDNLGHGTFVAGVIASSRECLGIAPDADLFIFRVFTVNQVSYTSWFLDAFNYAILKRIHVLNLSIGGPDFLDQPFVEKVWELSANGVVMVSAIGNDGPLYGTLNNPADMMDVVGVGGTDYEQNIAAFSSRGMTAWELPAGYGRVKPDVVTYGYQVAGSHKRSGCRTLSGTSVASPVVAGAVALLCSVIPEARRGALINPATLKQALVESAVRIEGPNMFEQGAGRLDLVAAYERLSNYQPRASAVPPSLDLTQCPYAWPYCTQPLYYGALPIYVNVTVLNGMGVAGVFARPPVFVPATGSAGVLSVKFRWSDVLWPWSGYLSVGLTVLEKGFEYDGVVSGTIEFEVRSPGQGHGLISAVTVPLSVRVVPTPPRSQRVLWDQFHSLRYPSGYFPRDNLRMKMDPLDWNGDHVHTNFRDLYGALRERGYFVEVLGEPLTCFDARQYGTLIIADSEDEFHPSEVEKLRADVEDLGLSVLVLAEWFSTDIMKDKIRFFDENTRQWWTPETGGGNVPALNDLLDHFGVALGGDVYEGVVAAGDDDVDVLSASSIVRFPQRGFLLQADLMDLGAEMVKGLVHKAQDVAILGLLQTPVDGGRIVVYTDSTCADSAHAKGTCFPFMGKLVEYAATGILDTALARSCKRLTERYENGVPPKRVQTNLRSYSRVLDPRAGFRTLPTCGNGTVIDRRPDAALVGEAAVDGLLNAKRGWVHPSFSGPRDGDAAVGPRGRAGDSRIQWFLFVVGVMAFVGYSVCGPRGRRRVKTVVPSV